MIYNYFLYIKRKISYFKKIIIFKNYKYLNKKVMNKSFGEENKYSIEDMFQIANRNN